MVCFVLWICFFCHVYRLLNILILKAFSFYFSPCSQVWSSFYYCFIVFELLLFLDWLTIPRGAAVPQIFSDFCLRCCLCRNNAPRVHGLSGLCEAWRLPQPHCGDCSWVYGFFTAYFYRDVPPFLWEVIIVQTLKVKAVECDSLCLSLKAEWYWANLLFSVCFGFSHL